MLNFEKELPNETYIASEHIYFKAKEMNVQENINIQQKFSKYNTIRYTRNALLCGFVLGIKKPEMIMNFPRTLVYFLMANFVAVQPFFYLEAKMRNDLCEELGIISPTHFVSVRNFYSSTDFTSNAFKKV